MSLLLGQEICLKTKYTSEFGWVFLEHKFILYNKKNKFFSKLTLPYKRWKLTFRRWIKFLYHNILLVKGFVPWLSQRFKGLNRKICKLISCSVYMAACWLTAWQPYLDSRGFKTSVNLFKNACSNSFFQHTRH